MGYGFGIMGWFGMLVPFLFVVLVIFLLVKPSQNNHRNKMNHNGENDALDILSERYAKGEISDEEYQHKRKVLRGL